MISNITYISLLDSPYMQLVLMRTQRVCIPPLECGQDAGNSGRRSSLLTQDCVRSRPLERYSHISQIPLNTGETHRIQAEKHHLNRK